MAYQDALKRIKDNILIDKKIQIYRLHYNYLKTCIKYPELFKIDEKKYSGWNLEQVKSLEFNKWWSLKGMKLLGRKLENVKEIKSNSFEKKPNTVIVEIPTNVPFQYSLKQIRALLKNKIIFEKKRGTEKNHHLKLAIYLEAWRLKKIEDLSLKETRRRLVAIRKILLKKRGVKAAMDRTATENFLKFVPSQAGNRNRKDGARHNVEIRHLERQISRYRSNAEKILKNVCLGKFPGKYVS
jgi:hypothetical protein